MNPNSMATLDLIPNLPIFAFLYILWILSVFLIAFLGKKYSSPRLYAVSICIYALVFLGFWSKFTGGNTYNQYSLSETHSLLLNGHLDFSNVDFMYRGYPALDILLSPLCLALNAEIFFSQTLLIVFFSTTFGLFMLLAFERVLKNWAYAWICVILLITANQTLSGHLSLLWGGVFSFPLLAILLFIVSSNQPRLKKWVLIGLIFPVLTLTYFPASAFFLLFMFVYALLTRKVSRVLLIFLCIIFITCNLYISISQVAFFTGLFTSQIQSFFYDPASTLSLTVFNPVRIASTGLQTTPLWGKSIQIFWVLLIIPFAIVVSAKKFFKDFHRPMATNNGWVAAGLLSAVIGGLTGGLALQGGFQLIYRLMIYVPFFSIPLMIAVFVSCNPKIRKLLFSFLIIGILLLSFPTFLVDHKQEDQNIDSVSSQQAFSFVFMSFPYGKGLTLFSSVQDNYGLNLYYFPYAIYVNERESVYVNVGANASNAFVALDNETSLFFGTGSHSVFIWTPRMYAVMENLFGISPDNQSWINIESKLTCNSQLVYNNGVNVVYYPR
jgi:hypothetical protein